MDRARQYGWGLVGVLGLAWALLYLAILWSPARVQAQPAGRFQNFGWAITHAPAANNQATISRAAATSQRHVAECVSAHLSAGAAAPTAVVGTVHLRDGATGAGTILQSWTIAIPATAGATAQPVEYCGLNAVGTVGTAMTLEFSAAGGANTVESVALKGRTE